MASEKEVAVVGIPRSGTTFLFRSIAGLPPGNRTPKDAAYKGMKSLKAHSLAPPESFGDQHAEDVAKHCDAGGKTIFVFAEPMPVVISTRLKRWDWLHASNCGFHTFKDKEPNIYKRDAFNYERMFDSWMRNNGYPVLAVRYETMHLYLDVIEWFLGRTVSWNQWVPRDREMSVNRVSARERRLISKTYASLENKWRNAPNVAIFGR